MKTALKLLVFLWSFHLSAQFSAAQADSIIRLLPKMKPDTTKVRLTLDAARSISRINSAQGFKYSKEALALSRQLNWNEGIAEAQYIIGSNYLYISKYDDAISTYEKGLKYATNEKQKSRLYLSVSNAYVNLSQYPKALDYSFKALKIRENSSDKKGVGRILVNIGEIYNLLQRPDKALESLRRANQIFDEIGEQQKRMELYRAMAVSYNNKRDPKKSIAYFEKAYGYCGVETNRHMCAALLSDIALVYFDTNEYDKVIRYSKASIAADTIASTDVRNTAFSYGVIGDAYIELAGQQNNKKLLDSAVTYLNRAVKMHREMKSWQSLYDDYTSLWQAHKSRGNYAESLASHELAMAYKDSIFNADNRETIKNIEDKRAIELRDKEIKINNLKLEAKERQKWILVAGLVLLGCIGLLLYKQSRNRRKNNEKLKSLNHELDQANKVRARFFSILNHDLRSPVYNLVHYLQLLKDSPELLDDQMKRNIETKNMAAAENLLQSMEDLLLWSKSQMERFKPEFTAVPLAQLFADVESHFTGSDVRFEVDLEDRELTFDTDRNYLLTILRNISGNAIKAMEHTPNPTITLKARSQHGAQYIWVSDNGPGAGAEAFRALYDENETLGISSGLGLHIIRDMAAAINCKVSVDSQPGVGTKFILSFDSA